MSGGIRLRLHLLPFFGKLRLSEVTPGKVQEYRVHRMTPPPARVPAPEAQSEDGKKAWPSRPWKVPARSTLHDEIVTLRQVLKTAIRHGWLTHLRPPAAQYVFLTALSDTRKDCPSPLV